jgi:hypothetical protein
LRSIRAGTLRFMKAVFIVHCLIIGAGLLAAVLVATAGE